ncbi:MAG: hypothetical protein HQK96_05895 [Nitrospirae bacterium]|nr:hypothetical protein [Nitrospirota bacterium]
MESQHEVNGSATYEEIQIRVPVGNLLQGITVLFQPTAKDGYTLYGKKDGRTNILTHTGIAVEPYIRQHRNQGFETNNYREQYWSEVLYEHSQTKNRTQVAWNQHYIWLTFRPQRTTITEIEMISMLHAVLDSWKYSGSERLSRK